MSRVELFDTTLRDGCQGSGVSFSVRDKVQVAKILDRLGIDWIEGGWPGANPKDTAFFEAMRTQPLTHAQLVAFGSTRRASYRAEDDPGLTQLIECCVKAFCIFGKSWTLHVTQGLRVSLDQNLALIADSIAFLKKYGEVFYDAEHFFDGYKADPGYALQTLQAAADSGARTLVLCDTNGGTMPWEIEAIVGEVAARFPTLPLGIHAHNDSGLAVANTLAAVRAGVCHVQGTLNGYGERTGNAQLSTIIADLLLKMKADLTSPIDLKELTVACRSIAELANLPLPENTPYVGRSAFAHKGGVHVAAVNVNPQMYEHVPPETVGNSRRVLVSEQSGRANLLAAGDPDAADTAQASAALTALLGRAPTRQEAAQLVDEVKRLEFGGYSFEEAEGSLVLIATRLFGLPLPIEPLAYHVAIDEHSEQPVSEATVQVRVSGTLMHTAAAGNGPVHALDQALRKALVPHFPELAQVRLLDYKVRVLDGDSGTQAQVRVTITSALRERQWGTVGLSTNVVNASWQALWESLAYPIALRLVTQQETSSLL